MQSYIVNIGGVDLTVKLTEKTADRLGAKPVEQKSSTQRKARKPQNKSKTPEDK